MSNPIVLIASKKCTVFAIPHSLSTSAMIFLKDFFVKRVLTKPTSSGTNSLNSARPTVVSTSLLPSLSLTLKLIIACKSIFSSLLFLLHQVNKTSSLLPLQHLLQ